MNKKNLIITIILSVAVVFAGVGFVKTMGTFVNNDIPEIIAKSVGADIRNASLACHVYSHRGASADEIEHTQKAYDTAIAQGSINIEQDVVLSKDGTLYVSHDRDAGRIAGVNKKYSEMTDEEIDQLRTEDGQKILKLSEVFDMYGRNVHYIVELKARDSRGVNAFIDLVTEYVMVNNVVVQSFDLGALHKIDKAFPDMEKLYLCQTQAGFEKGLKDSCVDIISVDKQLMNADNCKKAHDNDKMFSAWVLDTDDEITEAISLGVDTYFTNHTDRALRLEAKYRGR